MLNIKAGDDAVLRYRVGSNFQYRIVKIVRETKTLLITNEGDRFTKEFGRTFEKEDRYSGGTCLLEVNKETLSYVVDTERKIKRLELIKTLEDTPYEYFTLEGLNWLHKQIKTIQQNGIDNEIKVYSVRSN